MFLSTFFSQVHAYLNKRDTDLTFSLFGVALAIRCCTSQIILISFDNFLAAKVLSDVPIVNETESPTKSCTLLL